MVIRTYFEKNNTLINNNTTNTGRNPITELFYGGDLSDLEYSRFIFKVDETRLKDLYTGGTFPDITKMKHTLRMTNTSCFDVELLNGQGCDGKDRACSFDLNVFEVNQDWDEGTGYDYQSCTLMGGATSMSTNPSNWLYAQTTEQWSGGNGVFSGSPSGITVNTQHFDTGNENIEIDVTSYINGIITGNTNYGLGISYSYALENTPTSNLQYVGFFTRHTQTFYEPFIETIYSNTILDNRNSFYMDKNSKLYLYVNAGGVPTNLDNNPSVTINDGGGSLFSTYVPSGVTHVTKGVYSVDITVPSSAGYTDCTMFTDTWSGIQIDGNTLNDAELEFVVNTSSSFYNIGTTEDIPKNYGFTINGIKRDERIVRGDIRKVNVTARIPYTTNQRDLIDNLKYRLYVKEGPNEYTVVDYQDVDMGFEQNYFLVDTESLLPNTYWIDVELTTNREVRTIKDVVNFDIVGLVELRNNH